MKRKTKRTKIKISHLPGPRNDEVCFLSKTLRNSPIILAISGPDTIHLSGSADEVLGETNCTSIPFHAGIFLLMAFIQSHPAHPRKWLLCFVELLVRHKINNDLRRHLVVTIMRVRFKSSSKQPRSLNACGASVTVLYPAPLNLSAPAVCKTHEFLAGVFLAEEALTPVQGRVASTVKPVLSGHPRGMLYCPLNTACPPKTGFDS